MSDGYSFGGMGFSGLSASEPKQEWTRERPTKPGWYIAFNPEWGGPYETVELWDDGDITFGDLNSFENSDCIEKTMFLGPIPEAPITPPPLPEVEVT